MTRKRRAFSPEFKQEAASLVLDQGYSIPQACTSLGVGESALRRWVDQLSQERQGVTPKGKALTPEQRKIQELEARCKRLGSTPILRTLQRSPIMGKRSVYVEEKKIQCRVQVRCC